MRAWTLHPKYLDRIGISASWSEVLGGVRALLGLQKMHRNHSALERFKATGRPLDALGYYLSTLYDCNTDCQEASLDLWKLHERLPYIRYMPGAIPVTSGQIAYEQWFLWTKLRCRDLAAAGRLMVPTLELELHPLFYRVPGPVESWEKVK